MIEVLPPVPGCTWRQAPDSVSNTVPMAGAFELWRGDERIGTLHLDAHYANAVVVRALKGTVFP